MILPDYSEYLNKPGMLAWIEEQWKANPQIHDEHARVVNGFIDEHRIKTILEIGCGTGELAMRLKGNFGIGVGKMNYNGFDINPDCIMYAQIKNSPHHSFDVANVRDIVISKNVLPCLTISFGFLKHFGLHEWFDIFKRVASFGEYFIFDMPIAEQTKDDGTEFHHVWMSWEDLDKYCVMANLDLLEIVNADSFEPIFICKHR